MATAESQLTDWFNYLKQFKACCTAIDNDVDPLTNLVFANAKITDWLTTPDEVDDFAARSSAATNLPVTSPIVNASSTFLNLLETTYDFPNVYISAYVQSLTPAPYPTMDPGDCILQKATKVYPGGKTDANWTKTDDGLAGILGADCYSPAQRLKLAALVVDDAKTINDLVNQIVVFG